MPPAVTCRRATLAELPAVSAFVRGVYDAQVAPTESEEGRATFAGYAGADAMAARAGTHEAWLAEREGEIVGALEVRDGTHVALLFVARDAQRQGIGRALLISAFGPTDAWPELTVNSTPGAVAAYARLGFVVEGAEEERNGLRYQPMRRPAGESRST